MSVNKKYIGSDVNNDTQKYCPFCKVLKYRTEYNKNKARHDGLESLCKLCAKEKRKKLLSTPEGKKSHNERAKKWREENKEKYQEIHKKYREKNKDKLREGRRKLREYNKEYMRRRRKNPVEKMKHNVSRQVNHAIKRSGNSKKGESVFMYLPSTNAAKSLIYSPAIIIAVYISTFFEGQFAMDTFSFPLYAVFIYLISFDMYLLCTRQLLAKGRGKTAYLIGFSPAKR